MQSELCDCVFHLTFVFHNACKRYSLLTLRTSDSLNEGLPIKLPEKSFKENDIFSMKKIVGSILD